MARARDQRSLVVGQAERDPRRIGGASGAARTTSGGLSGGQGAEGRGAGHGGRHTALPLRGKVSMMRLLILLAALLFATQARAHSYDAATLTLTEVADGKF